MPTIAGAVTPKVRKSIISLYYSTVFQSKTIGIIGCGITLFLLIIFLAARKYSIEPSELTRDPNGILKLKPYVGMLTYFSLFTWVAISTICWFSYLVLRKVPTKILKSGFYLYSAIFISILVLDDTFQFHEVVFPQLIGIPEFIIYIIYSLILSVIIYKYYEYLLNKYVAHLFMAMLCFSLSIIIDLTCEGKNYAIFIEDSFKFFGVFFWLIFYLKTAKAELKWVLQEKPN